MRSGRPAELSGLLIAFVVFLFLFQMICDRLDTFETGDGGDSFGDERCIWIELLQPFHGGHCTGSFFEKAHVVRLAD